MFRLGVAIEAALEADALAVSLARPLEATLGGPERIAGALVLATEAAGALGEEVGHRLASRWPAAELVGTSFEGLVAEGRVWAGEPAVAVLAWSEGEGGPGVLALEGDASAEELAREIRAVQARSGDGAGLILLMPDALDTPDLAALRAVLASSGHTDGWLVGAGATGTEGGAARAWILPGDPGRRPDAGSLLVGVWLPSTAAPSLDPRRSRPPFPDPSRPESPAPAPRVRVVGATRLASPWLEITACRPHWIDALEGEPPIDWIRRQLGLADFDPLEPHLERLLVRIARGCEADPPPGDVAGAVARDVVAGRELPAGRGLAAGDVAARGLGSEGFDPMDFDERYLSGLDLRRGSISVSGSFARFDRLAFALPDPAATRDALREAVASLPATSLLLQLGCPGRGASLHGDADLESALIAHAAGSQRLTLGVLAPFQLASTTGLAGSPGRDWLRVHSTVLAAAGPVLDELD